MTTDFFKIDDIMVDAASSIESVCVPMAIMLGLSILLDCNPNISWRLLHCTIFMVALAVYDAAKGIYSLHNEM
jgi:hypothetical protein